MLSCGRAGTEPFYETVVETNGFDRYILMNTTSCFDRILGIVCSVFDAYSAVLIMPDNTGRGFAVAGSFSLGDHVNKEALFQPGKGLVGWILSNQAPMLVNDFDTRQYHLGYYSSNEESKIKAFMGVPLRNGVGTLCLDSKRQYSFSGKDQKILQLFADLVYEVQTSSCLAEERINLGKHYNCLQLVYGLRKRHKNWSRFLEQFLGLMAETSGFAYCSFASRDEAGNNYYIEDETQPVSPQDAKAIPYGSGLVGWVFKNGKPVFMGGADSATQASPLYGKVGVASSFMSVMCLPLVIGRITRGVLIFASEQPREIPEELKVFCQMASEHLALFLENLYLRSRLHEAAQQMHMLHQATAAPEPETPEADPEFEFITSSQEESA